jgi:hypothetical protein
MVPQWLVRVLMIVLLVAAAVSASGCEVVGGIFKAGMWVGALFIILIVGIVAFIAAKARG